MVGYGSSLRRSRRPGWEDAYLDYDALRAILEQIESLYEEDIPVPPNADNDNDILKAKFLTRLRKEIEKVYVV
jgi:SPX domain protein involved in polyphosphate accumulation